MTPRRPPAAGSQARSGSAAEGSAGTNGVSRQQCVASHPVDEASADAIADGPADIEVLLGTDVGVVGKQVHVGDLYEQHWRLLFYGVLYDILPNHIAIIIFQTQPFSINAEFCRFVC